MNFHGVESETLKGTLYFSLGPTNTESFLGLNYKIKKEKSVMIISQQIYLLIFQGLHQD